MQRLPRASYARYVLAFTMFVLLTALLLNLVNISYFSSGSNGGSNLDWSSLHGVNYLSSLTPWGVTSPNPSISFPQMQANGWNLIRVPLGWNNYLGNPSGFVSELTTIANQADQNGLYVIYDFHAITNQGWPSTLYNSYSSASAFYDAWWNNQTTFEGTYGWQAQFNDFWKTVISTVDSHPSTLGYEIMNEPPQCASPSYAACQQPYNQWVYDHIRAISAKAVVFCNPFNNPGGGPNKSPAAAQSAEPIGTNVVLDVHDYGATGSTLASDLSGWSTLTGLAGEFMGEFGVTTSTSQSAALSYFTSVFTELNAYGFGSTVWAWQCSGTYALLDSGCNQNYFDTAIVQAYTQVYGNSGTTSSTTSTSTTKSSTASATSQSTTTTSSTSTSSTLSASYSSSSTTTSSSLSSQMLSCTMSNDNPSVDSWVLLSCSGLPPNSSTQVIVYNNGTNSYVTYLYPGDTSSSGSLNFYMKVTVAMVGTDTLFIYSPETSTVPSSDTVFSVAGNTTSSTTTSTSTTSSSESTTTTATSTIVTSSTNNSFISSTTSESSTTSTSATIALATQSTISSTSFSSSSSSSSSSTTHGHNGQSNAQTNGQNNGKGNQKKLTSITSTGTISLSDITGGISSILSPTGILSMLGTSGNPPVAFGLAAYETTLIGGLGVLFGLIRRNRKNEIRDIHSWRW